MKTTLIFILLATTLNAAPLIMIDEVDYEKQKELIVILKAENKQLSKDIAYYKKLVKWYEIREANRIKRAKAFWSKVPLLEKGK